jgi:hypothetical protein
MPIRHLIKPDVGEIKRQKSRKSLLDIGVTAILLLLLSFQMEGAFYFISQCKSFIHPQADNREPAVCLACASSL